MLPHFLKDLNQSNGISTVFDFWSVLDYQRERNTCHTVDSWILTLCESMPMSFSLGYKNDRRNFPDETLFVVSGTQSLKNLYCKCLFFTYTRLCSVWQLCDMKDEGILPHKSLIFTSFLNIHDVHFLVKHRPYYEGFLWICSYNFRTGVVWLNVYNV